MAKSNLPPQAYTREVLAQAFAWLKEQPQNIRELANNADALVSLYLQSRRNGGQLPTNTVEATAPVSSKNFKNDLWFHSFGADIFYDGYNDKKNVDDFKYVNIFKKLKSKEKEQFRNRIVFFKTRK